MGQDPSINVGPDPIAVILPAAGKSQRFGASQKKIFARLGPMAVWQHCVLRLRGVPAVGPIVIAIAPDDRSYWQQTYGQFIEEQQLSLVDGGCERVDSVRAALELLPQAPWVAVHDAARPLVLHHDLQKVFTAAKEHGAALLARPLSGTVKRQLFRDTQSPFVASTVDRRGLWEALTPQVFRGDWLRDAYQRWRGFPVTDDAQLVERAGYRVHIVEGSPTNIKITVADDLQIAYALLCSQAEDGD